MMIEDQSRALRWVEELIPITCLAVGLALRWAKAVVTSANGNGGVWGVYLIYVLHIAFVRLFPCFQTFLSYSWNASWQLCLWLIEGSLFVVVTLHWEVTSRLNDGIGV